LRTSDFDFDLPPELIAQQPFSPREKTKMLVSDGARILDAQLINLTDFLQEGDVVVMNDARVIKAKLRAKSPLVEFNLDQENQGLWTALCKPAKKVKKGMVLTIAEDFFAEVHEKNDDGTIKIKFSCAADELMGKLEKYGSVPLPPYIKRDPSSKSQATSILPQGEDDLRNYQTIYAANGTAVAAPTAGLHFDEKIFAQLERKKIQKVFVTLNVGAGTFLPVRSELLKDHKMHSESFCLSEEAAEIINSAKARGKKILAVGTTSLRVLESCADEKSRVRPAKSTTQIFIYPPYQFKVVDFLMTNFHLPKSTLFMLICAFVGKEKACEIYNHAILQRYRFYSYGDASLLSRKS